MSAYADAMAVMRRAANQAGAVAKLVQYTVEPFLPGFSFPETDPWKRLEDPPEPARRKSKGKPLWSWNRRFKFP